MTVSIGRVFAEEESGIFRIVFSHPKGNSLTKDMMLELERHFQVASASTHSRVVLLQSTGEGAFCGGASFEELQCITSREQALEFFMGFAHIILAMFRCEKPVVCLAQGKAVGGGLSLICAADYVIATTEASLRLSEAAIGIGPFVISPALQRKLGHTHFAAMTLDTEWRNATWALEHGIYQKVCNGHKALHHDGRAFALELAGKPLDALRRLKRLFVQDVESLTLQDFEKLAAQSAELVLSQETQGFLRGE